MLPTLPTLEGPVISQFELVRPDKSPITLPTDEILHLGSTVRESTTQASEQEHRFQLSETTFADTLLRQALASPSPILRYRFGVRAAQSIKWMPWQPYLIRAHTLSPSGVGSASGYLLVVQTANEEFALDRQSKTAAHRGKISAIVRSIAERNQIRAVVVEDTSTEGVYYQTFQGDGEFIRNRLLSRAVNAKGVGGYLFFFQDGVLHFHTPSYQAGAFSYNYYAKGGASLTAVDQGQRLFPLGVAGVSIVRYDPYTGDSRQIASNPDLCLKYTESLYPLASVPGGALNVAYHTGANGDREAIAMAQSIYSVARVNAFHVKIVFRQFTGLRPGHILELIASPGENSAAPYSGRYLVTESNTIVDTSAFVVAYTLQRGETERLSGFVDADGAEGEAFVSEFAAPGQTIGDGETVSSTLARGSGKQTSDRVFTTVSDANSGPA